MRPDVYRYRSPGLWLLLVFLTVWSNGWLFGSVSSFLRPAKVFVNGRTVTGQEAVPYLVVALIIGVIAFSVWLYLVGFVLTARIEIEGEYISQYGAWNRRVCRGYLPGGKVLLDTLSKQGGRYQVSTDAGTVTFYGAIERSKELCDSIQQIVTRAANLPLDAPKEYRYRFGLIEWIWPALIPFNFAVCLADPNAPMVVQFVGLPIMMAFWAYRWMRVFKGREILEEDGYRSIDFKNQMRAQVPYAEIKSLRRKQSQKGNQFTLEIKSGRQTIRVAPDLKDYSEFESSLAVRSGVSVDRGLS